MRPPDCGRLLRERESPSLRIVGRASERGSAGKSVAGERHGPFSVVLPFDRVRPAVPAGHGAAIAGDRAFVVEIRQAMIRQGFAVHFDARFRRTGQRPGLQHAAGFEHEVEVLASRAVVAEDDESWHVICSGWGSLPSAPSAAIADGCCTTCR